MFRAYKHTGGKDGNGGCGCKKCGAEKEDVEHVFVKCEVHGEERKEFEEECGVTLGKEEVWKILALDAESLKVQPEMLSRALFRMLERIWTKWEVDSVSVAQSLGCCNQGARSLPDQEDGSLDLCT